jgi:hypothetical protein
MNRIIQQYLKEIGRRGGQSTSPAKQAASRTNGTKGGRPAPNADQAHSEEMRIWKEEVQQAKMAAKGIRRSKKVRTPAKRVLPTAHIIAGGLCNGDGK